MSARWAGRLEGPATVLVVVAVSLGVTVGASWLASARTFIGTIGVETGSLLVADYGVDPAGTEFAPLVPEIIESAASDRGVAQPTLPAVLHPPARTVGSSPAIAPVRDEAPERPPLAASSAVAPTASPFVASASPASGSTPSDSDSLASVAEPPSVATERPASIPTPPPTAAAQGGGGSGVVTPVVDNAVGGLGDALDGVLPGLGLGETVEGLTAPLDPVTGLVDDAIEPVTDLLEPTVDEVLDPVEDLTEPLDPLLGDVIGGLLGGLFG